MKTKNIFSKVTLVLALILLLGSGFNTSQASGEHKDVYPELSEAEREDVSVAMYWLYKRENGYHYRDKSEDGDYERAAIFTSMEQARAGFHGRETEYYWDNYKPSTNWERDPLHAFEGAHDKGEASGVDWYLKNFWNIEPSRPGYTGGEENIGAYYHDGYYYKYYHRFADFSRPVVEKLYDLGDDYYLVDYALAFDHDWDSWSGTYYAVLKKNQVDGKMMYSAIYNQNLHEPGVFERRTISKDQALKEAFPEGEIAGKSDEVRAGSIDILIDKDKIDLVDDLGRPYLDTYERIMIPVRLVSEKLGHEVGWIEETRTISIDEDIFISLEDGGRKIFIESLDKYIEMDTEVEIKDDRTYVPVRYIVEALGHKLDYENKQGDHLVNILKNQGSFGTSTIEVK